MNSRCRAIYLLLGSHANDFRILKLCLKSKINSVLNTDCVARNRWQSFSTRLSHCRSFWINDIKNLKRKTKNISTFYPIKEIRTYLFQLITKTCLLSTDHSVCYHHNLKRLRRRNWRSREQLKVTLGDKVNDLRIVRKLSSSIPTSTSDSRLMTSGRML